MESSGRRPGRRCPTAGWCRRGRLWVYAREQRPWADGGDAGWAAITGFCWGERIAWLYAAHNQNLKVGVAWYGRLVGEPSANAPRFPIYVAAYFKVPVLSLYGGADQGSRSTVTPIIVRAIGLRLRRTPGKGLSGCSGHGL